MNKALCLTTYENNEGKLGLAMLSQFINFSCKTKSMGGKPRTILI